MRMQAQGEGRSQVWFPRPLSECSFIVDFSLQLLSFQHKTLVTTRNKPHTPITLLALAVIAARNATGDVFPTSAFLAQREIQAVSFPDMTHPSWSRDLF